MSYDIQFTDPKTDEVALLDTPHNIAGGTYAVGGTREAWVNVTYNYSPIFGKVLGELGIKVIQGKTGKEIRMLLITAIDRLDKNDKSTNYWDACENNAREALKGVLYLAP